MAQLVLTVVGSLIAGPPGAAIGAVIGGYIDQTILFPTNIKGPQLSDLTVTSSAYGLPIPIVFGPENRLTGNVIWSTGLVERSKKKKSGKGGPSVTTYSYSTSLAILLSQGENVAVKRIWANSKLIYDSSAPTSFAVFSSIAFYPGNGTQGVDPTIEAAMGAGNAPAYRHSCYVVIKDLQLADFGNGVPNLEFEVEGSEGELVSDWLRSIVGRTGISGTDISFTQVTSEGRGYVIASEMSAFAAIETLGLAYNFDLPEQAGQIRAVNRGNGIKATIPIDDMAASSGDEKPEPIRIETLPPQSMPREVLVTYSDPALDFQRNSQRASRTQGDAKNNINRELALVIDATAARQLADLLLWDGWASRRTATIQLSDKWHSLASGDVIGLPLGDFIAQFKILRATRGANGIMNVDARLADPDAYISSSVGAAGVLPSNPLKLPGETRLVLIDMPIVRDEDDNAGFYWAAAGDEAGWRGAEILRSSDGGTTYIEMSGVAVRSGIGDVATALPAGPADYWDRGNVITVVMHYDDEELESVAESAVLNGANAFWLGGADGQDGEIAQFATATLIAPQTYELTDLLRGRQGTDHLIGSHGANEVFVMLEPDALGRSDYGAGDWDKARLYKPVSILTAEADTDSQSFTNEGEGKTPLSVVGVSGERDVSDNLTIAWHRRSRLSGAGLFGGDPPLGEDVEAYEIDIIVASVVVRTLTSATQNVEYSAANQTSDGITPGNPVTGDIYQMSGSRGRGNARRFTV